MVGRPHDASTAASQKPKSLSKTAKRLQSAAHTTPGGARCPRAPAKTRLPGLWHVFQRVPLLTAQCCAHSTRPRRVRDALSVALDCAAGEPALAGLVLPHTLRMFDVIPVVVSAVFKTQKPPEIVCTLKLEL
jgi:hypothetical protein